MRIVTLFLAASTLVFCNQLQSQILAPAKLGFTISESGNVSADLKIPLNPQLAQRNLWLIFLPIAINPHRRFMCASDVHVSQLDTNEGYAVLVIATPSNLTELQINIDDANQITETPNGQGKFQFDPTYAFIPQAERELLSLPFCISQFDITVTLPKKYDEADVYASPASFVRKGEKAFFISSGLLQSSMATHGWISFPNPVQQGLELSKCLFGLVFGVFGIILQAGLNIRERSKNLLWGISIVSLLVVSGGLYLLFGLSTSKRVEFLSFAIAALINAVYALIVSIYALIAKKYQGVIAGQVNINGAPSTYSQVSLMRTDSNPPIVITQREELKHGQYFFSVWRTSRVHRYQIVARYTTVENKSEEFTLTSGQRHQVPVINLTAPTIGAPTRP